MKTLLLLCLCIAAAACPAAKLVEQDLKDALALYRELELPVPPRDAPLIVLSSGGVAIINGVRQPEPRIPAFRLPASKGATNSFQFGCWVYDDPYGWSEDNGAKPEDIDFSALEHRFLLDNTFKLNQLVCMALLLQERGKSELALKLLEIGLKRMESMGSPGQMFEQPPQDDPKAMLVDIAWAWCGNRLALYDTDRAALFARMKGLRTKYKSLATKQNDEFMAQLDAAVNAKKEEPGSMEEIVAGLAECRVGRYDRGPKERDERFDAAMLKGFDIVPALISFIEDKRLTRSIVRGQMMMPTHFRLLKDVASLMLTEMAGEGLKTGGATVTAEEARAWFKTAKELGEEEYFSANLFKGNWPVGGALRILAARFPARLCEEYKRMLADMPDVVGWPVAEQVANLSLPKEKRVEVLLIGARCKTGSHRIDALRHLAKLDENSFCEFLTPLLDAAPVMAPASVWTSNEARLPHLVLLTANEKVWQAFLRAAKRADVALRVEYMNPFNYTYLGDTQRARRLSFLAAFLDDETVYDVASSGQDGPHAAFEFDKISVRDFAASKAASILRLDQSGDPEWSDGQWTTLRAQVREALKKEGIEPLKSGEK